MIFADLLANEKVFLDANTFIYHFTADPVLGPPCSQLFHRVENGEISAFISIHLLAEVSHKLMGAEASARFGWPLTGMANRLRRHHTEVRQLTSFRRAIGDVAQSRIQVLPLSVPLLVSAMTLCHQTGLLTNDALSVAIMQANGLTKPGER